MADADNAILRYDERNDEEPVGGQISFGFARRHGVLVSDDGDDEAVTIGHRADTPIHILAELRRHLAKPVALEQLSDEVFDQRLREVYETQSGQAMQAMEEISEADDLASIADSMPEPEDLLESEDDAPIIRLINALLTEAVQQDASDIHVEPFEARLAVRFRIDGVLRELLQPPRSMAPLLVSRIKVMARLDIAEKRIPQDGRISLRVAGRPIDVRVSTLPGGSGERVVMRLLDKQTGRLELQHLGMPEQLRRRCDEIIHKPHGIFLVTGPTGSGKSTSLYGALNRLNDRSRNILTVEDPIEYYVDGIGQTQVNTKVDMTFARGLRAILRQDPDTVMIGEVRDLETAEIAVQASLTGHLVLSTLHTNTAVGAVTRLRDMGVEPYLLSSSLVGVLAQRLIRRLCAHCCEPYEATADEREILGIDGGDQSQTLYRAVGCEHCNQMGYRGRSGLFELLQVDDTMRQLIHDGAGEQALEAHGRQYSDSLRQDGLRRVLEGVTTLEEVLRVSTEDI